MSTNINLSVVITTYNREKELIRCLQSIPRKFKGDEIEIIVIDDYSTEKYQSIVSKLFPNVKYIYLSENGGPCIARNKGIEIAESNFVLIMDDDDVFTGDAFEIILEYIDSEVIQNYPVTSFLISNAEVSFEEEIHIYTFDEIIQGKLKGDTIQLINKNLWNKEGYTFPNYKIGAESLIWYRVALDYGYPVINKVIVNIMEDAKERLTNFSNQIYNANLFAQYQLDIINNFKDKLIESGNKKFLIKKYKGAITYLLLSNKKSLAFNELKKLIKYDFKSLLYFFPLFFITNSQLKRLFLKYRNR